MSKLSDKLTVVNEKGEEIVLYEPLPHQLKFHKSNAPNLLALGTRGTGKSLQLRFDAILRCLMIPNFRALILRRTMPELRRSHLAYIDHEMKMLGGVFLQTTFMAKFSNGSTIQFGHCETESDVLNYLSSEYGFIGFDELSTWSLNQFLQISAAARAPMNAPYKAVVRAGSNPLGVGAEWMRAWFCDHTAVMEEYPDYHPDDYQMIFSTLNDNPHLNRQEYTARLRNLPEHVRRAWLLGEFVVEGAYFSDFQRNKIVKYQGEEKEVPWHVMPTIPTWKGESLFATSNTWISIYRCIDWGYFPDPAVCLWVAMLPNKHEIVFKERSWKKTLATDVATAIKRESEGMRVVETFCDPQMFAKTGQAPYSIAEQFEQNGIPLTASLNDRALFGYSLHQHFNTLIHEEDGPHPQLQIVQGKGAYGCPDLIRTIPTLQMDKNDSKKVAAGDDHWAVALGYYCMGQAMPSQDPIRPTTPFWRLPKHLQREIISNVPVIS